MRLSPAILVASGMPWVLGGTDCIRAPFACTLNFVSGVEVRVTHAQTGEGITNAVLTLTEGEYSETLRAPGDPFGSYTGAGERPGTYTLTVVASGFASQTVDNIMVRIEASGCHVETVDLSIELTPTG